jgi:hypothetical protein
MKKKLDDDLPIYDWEISTRLYNGLLNLNIRRLSDLRGKDLSYFFKNHGYGKNTRMPAVGQKSIRELVLFARSKGIEIAPPKDRLPPRLSMVEKILKD